MIYFNEHDAYAAEWLRNLYPEAVVDTRSIHEVQPSDLAGMERVGFFAGIGGWEEALRLAEWVGPIWHGSCPCQPFSQAGKGKGTADERHLWPEMFRLIRECRPSVVVGEQVASPDAVGTGTEAAFVAAVRKGEFGRANELAERIAERNSGIAPEDLSVRWLDGISADLETAGYTVWTCILGAHSSGAPHIRQRIFWGAKRLANNPSGGHGISATAQGEDERSPSRHDASGQLSGGPEGHAIPGGLADSGPSPSRSDSRRSGVAAAAGSDESERERQEAVEPGRCGDAGRLANAGEERVREPGRGTDAGAAAGVQRPNRKRQRVRFDFGPSGPPLSPDVQRIIDEHGYWPRPCPDCGLEPGKCRCGHPGGQGRAERSESDHGGSAQPRPGSGGSGESDESERVMVEQWICYRCCNKYDKPTNGQGWHENGHPAGVYYCPACCMRECPRCRLGYPCCSRPQERVCDTGVQRGTSGPDAGQAAELRSDVGGMGDTDSGGREARSEAAAANGHGCAALADGSEHLWLGHADSGGRGQADDSEPRRDSIATGWSDFRIIPCGDGKSRRISAQSGDEPLASGIPKSMGRPRAILEGMGYSPTDIKRILRRPRSLLAMASRNRVGRLRGYGNAISPIVTAVFLRAFAQCLAATGVAKEQTK